MLRRSAVVATILLLQTLLSVACEQVHSTDQCDHSCQYSVCYYREDGTSPVAEGIETVVVAWSVTKEGNSWDSGPVPFWYAPPSNMVYYGALVGPWNEDPCVENHFCGSGHMAVWAKTRGYAPAVTFPVDCGHTARQVLEPIPADEDSAEICPTPAGDNPCDAQVTLVGPGGIPGPADIWWFDGLDTGPGRRSQIVPIGAFDLRYDGGALDLSASTLLVYSDGYLPQITCLHCGPQTVQLEASPYTWPPPSGGCRVAGRAEDTAGPRFAFWLLAFAAMAAGHRRRQGRRSDALHR